MKQCLAYFLVLFVFASCKTLNPEEELQHFLILLEEHKEQYMPGSKQVIIFDSTYQRNRLHFAEKGQQRLSRLDTTKLSPSSRLKHQEIIQELGGYIQAIKQDQIYQTDPSQYDIWPNLLSSFLQLERSVLDSLSFFEYNLRAVAPFYQTAKAQLRSATPEKIADAIQRNRQTYLYLSQQLPEKLKKIPLEQERKAHFLNSIDEARLAVKDYIAFCKSLEFEYYDQKNNPTLIQ